MRGQQNIKICLSFIISLSDLLLFRRWMFRGNIQKIASKFGSHAYFLIFAMLWAIISYGIEEVA